MHGLSRGLRGDERSTGRRRRQDDKIHTFAASERPGQRVLETDFLVVGTGVAGLRAALELSRHGRVLIATKDQPAESNSAYAQGGVAVALAEDDDAASAPGGHAAGRRGIVSPEAARILVEEGPERVRELVSWGARFDRAAGRTHFTREAAHSRNRVLHALGDATGWEIVRTLLERVHGVPPYRGALLRLRHGPRASSTGESSAAAFSCATSPTRRSSSPRVPRCWRPAGPGRSSRRRRTRGRRRATASPWRSAWGLRSPTSSSSSSTRRPWPPGASRAS